MHKNQSVFELPTNQNIYPVMLFKIDESWRWHCKPLKCNVVWHTFKLSTLSKQSEANCCKTILKEKRCIFCTVGNLTKFCFIMSFWCIKLSTMHSFDLFPQWWRVGITFWASWSFISVLFLQDTQNVTLTLHHWENTSKLCIENT